MSVLLISLPGTYPSFPAVGLELIAHGLRARGHSPKVVYGHLDIARYLDGPLLRSLCQHNVWDLLYGHLAYPGARVGLRSKAVVRMLTDPSDDYRFSERQLVAAARGVSRLNRDVLRELALRPPPRLVGFTVQNNQLLAAKYFARAVKQAWGARVLTVVGGASVRDGLGRSILEHHPEFDFVSEGDGVREIDELLRSPRVDHLPRLIPKEAPSGCPAPPVRESSLSYDEFYEARRALDPRHDFSVFHPWDGVPAMLATGCRWGRCHFCNLRDTHEEDSPRAVVDAIVRRTRATGIPKVFLVDLSQPARSKLRRFFRQLEGRPDRYAFGAMFRCDIGRTDLLRFRRNGLDICHLGIESFSDRLLKQMNKGVRLIDIAETLIACVESGVRVEGNIIVNLPWERAEDVAETRRNLAVLSHLMLPRIIDYKLSHGSILFRGSRRIRRSDWVPEEVVRFAYPARIRESIGAMYYTRRTYELRREKEWLQVIRDYERYARDPPQLLYEVFADGLLIHDTRDVAAARRFFLRHRRAGPIYEYCKTTRTSRQLRGRFRNVPEAELASTLDDFVSKKIMMQSGERFLSLALDRNG